MPLELVKYYLLLYILTPNEGNTKVLFLNTMVVCKICQSSPNNSGDQIETNEMVWACNTYGGRGVVCPGFWWGILRPLGRPRCRWEDNINTQEVGCVGMDWIELARDRERWRALVNAVMNLRFL